MMFWKRTALPVLLSTVWISVSEFARNEFILKSVWTAHYAGFGRAFPSAPINGAMWGVWALCYSALLLMLTRRFTLAQTFVIGWGFGFVLMWLVIGNLGVLPFALLPVAVPLSLLECFVASWILKKLSA